MYGTGQLRHETDGSRKLIRATVAFVGSGVEVSFHML